MSGEKRPPEKVMKYEKRELIKSRKWNRYTLESLLEDGKTYSIAEVEKLVKKG